MKNFHEKHKELLQAEGFIITSQSKNNTNYEREDGIFINVSKQNDKYITVTSTLSKEQIKYTTTISHADPSGIFERLIRRFHNQNMYQNK